MIFSAALFCKFCHLDLRELRKITGGRVAEEFEEEAFYPLLHQEKGVGLPMYSNTDHDFSAHGPRIQTTLGPIQLGKSINIERYSRRTKKQVDEPSIVTQFKGVGSHVDKVL